MIIPANYQPIIYYWPLICTDTHRIGCLNQCKYAAIHQVYLSVTVKTIEELQHILRASRQLCVLSV